MSSEERQRMERESMEKTPSGVEPEVTMRRTPSVGVEGPVTWEEMRALMQREPTRIAVRTWMATTGGLLAIVAGGWNIFIGIATVLTATFSADLIGNLTAGTSLTTEIGWSLIGLGAISVIGGSLAIARRAWGMALAGSITALVPSPAIVPTLLGVLSVIFITLGRPDFWSRAKAK